MKIDSPPIQCLNSLKLLVDEDDVVVSIVKGQPLMQNTVSAIDYCIEYIKLLETLCGAEVITE